MPGDASIFEGVPDKVSSADLFNTVAMKLPPFWPENIETWFVQSESQFQLKGLTSSQTKFDYCVQSMTQEVTVKVLDLIWNPLLPTTLTSTSRTGYSTCLPSMITPTLKQLPTWSSPLHMVHKK